MTLLDRYDAFVVDLDGVVWRGSDLLEGAVEGLQAIIESKKPLLLLTNNAAYPQSWVVTRLQAEGVDIEEGQVLTSAIVAREWIRENVTSDNRALVLGPENLRDTLDPVVYLVDIMDASIDIVVVARDLAFDFERLTVASNAIRGGAIFLAVNQDATMPLEGRIEPGTGPLVAAIEIASGCPPTVLGKPHSPMMLKAAALVSEPNTLMIGDRPESDVAGARVAGWASALVLSGVSQSSDRFDPKPDYVMSSLLEITEEISPYAG